MGNKRPQEDLRALTERFVKIIYTSWLEGAASDLPKVKNELEEVLNNTYITNQFREYIVKGVISQIEAQSISFPVSDVKRAYGIDLENNQYGIFNPINAEAVEWKMIDFWKYCEVRRPSLDEHPWYGDGFLKEWIEEFKQKYGYDPTTVKGARA